MKSLRRCSRKESRFGTSSAKCRLSVLGLAVDGENERRCRDWASRTRRRDTHGGQSRLPGESLEDRRLLLSKEERGRKHQAQRRLRRSPLVARWDRERAVVWEESSQSERRKDHTFQGCTYSWSCTHSIGRCSTKPGSCRQVGAVTLEGRGRLLQPAVPCKLAARLTGTCTLLLKYSPRPSRYSN
jgi:hypothetical protein